VYGSAAAVSIYKRFLPVVEFRYPAAIQPLVPVVVCHTLRHGDCELVMRNTRPRASTTLTRRGNAIYISLRSLSLLAMQITLGSVDTSTLQSRPGADIDTLVSIVVSHQSDDIISLAVSKIMLKLPRRPHADKLIFFVCQRLVFKLPFQRLFGNCPPDAPNASASRAGSVSNSRCSRPLRTF